MFYLNNKSSLCFILFITPLILSSQEGENLFNEAKCMACHNSQDFKKRKEKVNNFKRLQKSVASCAFGNNVGWFDEDMHEVSKYLNKRYYHFKKVPLQRD